MDPDPTYGITVNFTPYKYDTSRNISDVTKKKKYNWARQLCTLGSGSGTRSKLKSGIWIRNKWPDLQIYCRYIFVQSLALILTSKWKTKIARRHADNTNNKFQGQRLTDTESWPCAVRISAGIWSDYTVYMSVCIHLCGKCESSFHKEERGGGRGVHEWYCIAENL